MKIGISSHARYSDALTKCVSSFEIAGFPGEDVHVFVGGSGCEGYSPLASSYCAAHAVPHDSFDFTAMISVLDLDLEAETWMFVHDTVTVNETFRSVLDAGMNGEDVLALTDDGPSMNMGAFSWSKLTSLRDDLQRFRNASKSECVRFEDVYLAGAKAMNSARREVLGPEDVYGAGTPRIVEHYPDVGLRKYKANWNVKETYCLDP